MLDADAARAGARRAATRSSTCRRTPTCATGSSSRARDLEQNTIATSTVLEAMRAAGVDADRVLLDRLGLRRAGGLPDARGRARSRSRPRSTRASKLAGEGMIRRLRHGYGFTGVDLPLRLDPRRALHARARLRLLPRAAGRPDAAARARRRPPGEVVPLRAGLRLGDPDRARGARTRPGAIDVYNLGTDETIVVDDSIADDHRAPRRHARARAHGRQPRLARRQPADPPRLRAHPRARLGADADDPRRDQTHARLARGESDRPRRAGGAHERHLQPRAAAREPRRRRHRPAVVLPRARRLPRQRRDRQVRLHAHAHRLPAPLPDEVLGVRGGRRRRPRSATRSCARRCCATGAATRWRSRRSPTSRPAPGMGSSGAFTVCLLKALALARRVAIAAGATRRGRLRDRDRRPAGAGRQAGPVRRRARRDLRVHVPPGRHGRRRAARALRRETLDRLREQPPALLHRRGARGVARSSPTRSSAPRAATRRCCENLHRTKEIGHREPARCSRPATSSSYAELMHEHWENKRRRSPGMATERIDHALHAGAPQRRGRRQARRRRRRRLPARLRAPARRHAPGDGGGAARRSCASTSSSRAATASSTRERVSERSAVACASASSAAG